MSPSRPCPPAHAEYPSSYVASNAVTLHAIQHPHCGGYSVFQHGDHFHVGHTSPAVGAACKADPVHTETRRRVRRRL